MERKTVFTMPPVDLLPNCDPLPGAVVAQYRRRGEQTFGPYWFRVWREGGKMRKVYVKATELEAVRLACKAHRLASKSPASRRREWASWRRKDMRAWNDFLFVLKCRQRLDEGRPLHYLQERKAQRILGLGP